MPRRKSEEDMIVCAEENLRKARDENRELRNQLRLAEEKARLAKIEILKLNRVILGMEGEKTWKTNTLRGT